jgi:hypothetical protein
MEPTLYLSSAPKLYRPRRPERAPFYAVLHQFFDRFTREYEQRFERTFGPLRGIVPKTVERFFGWGTQLVHYYGAYSNAHRGIGFRREAFIEVPPEDEPSDPPRPDSSWPAARRKSWARLIRRVYEVDPFLCRCGERMRVVGFITHPPIIRKVLDHIGRREGP